jgi:hypothetical protein
MLTHESSSVLRAIHRQGYPDAYMADTGGGCVALVIFGREDDCEVLLTRRAGLWEIGYYASGRDGVVCSLACEPENAESVALAAVAACNSFLSDMLDRIA